MQQARKELKSDLLALRMDNERLLQQKEAIKKQAVQFNEVVVLLRQTHRILKEENGGLGRRFDDLKGVQLEDLVRKRQSSLEGECFELESELMGVQESVLVVEELFLGDEEVELSDVLEKLDSLFGMEFEAKKKSQRIEVSRRF